MRIAAIVQRGKLRGDIGDVPTLEATYHYFGAYTYGLLSRLSGAVANRDDQQALLRRSLEALTRGFCASGA